jgi:hypothetical protein
MTQIDWQAEKKDTVSSEKYDKNQVISELKDLSKSIKDQNNEMQKFEKMLSDNNYKLEDFNKLKESIKDKQTKIKDTMKKIVENTDDVVWDEKLLADFNIIKESRNMIDKAIEELEKSEDIEHEKPIEMKWMKPRSCWDDLELNATELSWINGKKYVCNNWEWVDYYLVDIPWKWPYILRVNTKDPNDEVAALPLSGDNIETKTNVELSKIIWTNELYGNFKDVEMDSSASISNVGNIVTWALWWWVAWAVGTTWVWAMTTWVWGGVFWFTAAWCTLPVIWWATWAALVTWATVWAMTDLDLTTEDLTIHLPALNEQLKNLQSRAVK